MPCQSTTFAYIDARCDTSIGGIKRILIANYDDITGVTVSSEANKRVITAVSLADGKVFKQWLFRRSTGSYSSSMASDEAIGNKTITTEVSIQFSKADAPKRLAIQNALHAGAIVIVEDMLGGYIYLGKDSEVTITSSTMQSGTATSDLNGFNLTFQDVATELPYFVEPSIIPGLLVGPTPKYTVTFAEGSHTGTVEGTFPAPQQVEQGQSITLPSGITTSTYESVYKWSDGTNTYDPGAQYTPTGNVTLTAQWGVEFYSVTYEEGDWRTKYPGYSIYGMPTEREVIVEAGTTVRMPRVTPYVSDDFGETETNPEKCWVDQDGVEHTKLTYLTVTKDYTLKPIW